MGTDADAPFELAFDLTQAELLQACHELFVWDRAADQMPASRVVAGIDCNRAYSWGVVLLTGGLFLGSIALLTAYTSRDPLKLLLGVVLGLVAVVGAYLFGKARLGYRVILQARDPFLSVQAIRAHPRTSLLIGKRTATLDTTGFQWSGEQERIFVGWPRILAFVPLESCVAVVMQETMPFPIPRRTFQRPEDAARFCEMGERQLRLHGCDLESRLTKYFSQHEPRCGGCGYALKGCRTLHCPECGRELGLEDFPDARWEQLPALSRSEQDAGLHG